MSQPSTVQAVLGGLSERLRSAGIDSARAEAELMCAHVLGMSRGQLFRAGQVPAVAVEAINRLADERIRDRTPLQYVLGYAVSGALDLAVGPGVFIPRPETELLVADTLGGLPLVGSSPPPIVVDLCAGSGTIALEIAHRRPDVTVHAVELYPEALGWLRKNASVRAQAGDSPITIHAADATSQDLLEELSGSVEAVVSNPPYIPLPGPGVPELPPEVSGHEPASALYGGADGLVVIVPLVSVAARLLAPGGRLLIEHDDSTGAEVAALLEATGDFGTVEQHTDLSGRPRYVSAARSVPQAQSICAGEEENGSTR